MQYVLVLCAHVWDVHNHFVCRRFTFIFIPVTDPEGAGGWYSFLLDNLVFTYIKLTKRVNNVLAPPISDEPQLTPLHFKVSGSAPFIQSLKLNIVQIGSIN